MSIKTCVKIDFLVLHQLALYMQQMQGQNLVKILMISTSIFFAQFSNCSIAAALKVSDAASITLFPLPFNILLIFPIVVVFPTPLTPEINVAFNFSFFFEEFNIF